MDAKVQQLDVNELQRRLGAWEKQYGMTSAECEQRYFSGELGDSQEMLRWVHDYHAYKALLKHQKSAQAVGA